MNARTTVTPSIVNVKIVSLQFVKHPLPREVKNTNAPVKRRPSYPGMLQPYEGLVQ